MYQHRSTAHLQSPHPPASVKEATATLEELTGIKRSENRIRAFPKSIGMAPRKVGMIHSKADSDEQEQFIKDELEPRLEVYMQYPHNIE